DASRIADEQRNVVWPIEVRIDAHVDRDLRASDQAAEQLANSDRVARADVVGSAGLAAFCEQRIRAHGVANIREIAARIEVADPQLWSVASRLDFRNLTRHARRDERRILPRTDVVERTGDRHLDAVCRQT